MQRYGFFECPINLERNFSKKKERFLFFPYSVFHAFHEFHRVILEEIEIHGLGNFQDQSAVKRRLVEDFVEKVTGAANLARQPAGTAAIDLQLLADEVPDVDIACWLFHKLTYDRTWQKYALVPNCFSSISSISFRKGFVHRINDYFCIKIL